MSIELDTKIAQLEATAKGWEEDAARHCRNEFFYRSLIVKIGETFGKAAYTSDDGSVQQDVLCLKVPELVNALREDMRQSDRQVDNLNIEIQMLKESRGKMVEQEQTSRNEANRLRDHCFEVEQKAKHILGAGPEISLLEAVAKCEAERADLKARMANIQRQLLYGK